jgi:uncharacterized FlaG/YvyC family protein
MGGGGVTGAVTGALKGVVTGGPVGFFTGMVEGYESGRAQEKAKKAQREQQAYQQKIINEQKKEALDTRKAQINQMREQIGTGGSYQTRRTSEKGIVGKLGEETLG